jgi:hypothetical protein
VGIALVIKNVLTKTTRRSEMLRPMPKYVSSALSLLPLYTPSSLPFLPFLPLLPLLYTKNDTRTPHSHEIGTVEGDETETNGKRRKKTRMTTSMAVRRPPQTCPLRRPVANIPLSPLHVKQTSHC